MAAQVQKLDSFRILLNEISHQLTEQNLQSLIHIYNVPGGVRKQINDGLALFSYMMTQDYISREKVGNLHHLLKTLRPRRRDLVSLVEDYIKSEFQTDDVRKVLHDLSESWEPTPKSGSPPPDEPEAVFKIDNSYLRIHICVHNCECLRVPSCYAPIIVLLLLAIIATAIFWYADVPKISHSITANKDLHDAGVYILLLEILAILVVIVLRFRGIFASCLACQKPGHDVLTNIQEGPTEKIVSSTSTARLHSVASRPRPYGSTSESGAFSYPSGDCASTSTFGTFDPMASDMPDSSGAEA